MAARKKQKGARGTSARDPMDAVASGDIAPIYYLCGEGFPRDRLVSAIRQAVLGGEANAFNFDGIEGKGVEAATILAAARTMPMLGPRRLVQVRDAHLLKSDCLNALLPYVADPAPSTVLLMVGESADLRLKFFGQLKKTGVVHRYDPLKERYAGSWVQTEAKRAGVKLAPGASQRIADAVGVEMGQLAAAIEQLGLYAGLDNTVTIEHVEELLAQTRQRSIFELTNAVGRGDRREAMLVLRQMAAAKEPALRIVAMLTRHLRQLWSLRELADRRATEKEMAEAVGLHPFFVKDMLTQAKRFDVSKLSRTHRALLEADRTLKSSKLPDPLVMDRLVLSLVPAR